MSWSGVVSFYASEHAMRAERVLERLGLTVRLVPGPREISPNCGVAVAFHWDDAQRIERGLADARVPFEAIHHHELSGAERADVA